MTAWECCGNKAHHKPNGYQSDNAGEYRPAILLPFFPFAFLYITFALIYPALPAVRDFLSCFFFCAPFAESIKPGLCVYFRRFCSCLLGGFDGVLLTRISLPAASGFDNCLPFLSAKILAASSAALLAAVIISSSQRRFLFFSLDFASSSALSGGFLCCAFLPLKSFAFSSSSAWRLASSSARDLLLPRHAALLPPSNAAFPPLRLALLQARRRLPLRRHGVSASISSRYSSAARAMSMAFAFTSEGQLFA